MKTKFLGTLAISLGIFLCAGVASASTTEILQPASDIIYNENVDINGSLNVDSLRVGTAGLGGVTFFNGSVLNEGATDPFTIADDMRVDGEIWRGSKGGDPIKISDNVTPTLTDINDFGDSTHRWKNVYSVQGNFSGNLHVNGISGLTDTDIPNNITADNYLELSGGTILGLLSVNGINGLTDTDIPNTITASKYLPLAGGTLTGALTVNGVSGLKDSDIPNTITVNNYLPVAGGTLTGGLTVNGVTGLTDSDVPDSITASNYLQLIGGTLTGALTVNGVTGLSDADIPDGITASNYLLLSGGTITGNLIVNGDINVGNNLTVQKVTATQGLTVSQTSTFVGDIHQTLNNNGAIKATVDADAAGGCNKSWASSTTTPIVCTRVNQGYYEINFPYDINNRYWQATAATTSPVFVVAQPSATTPDIMYVHTWQTSGTRADTDFMLNIY